jgi:DNA-binding response OmpR family regulator
MVNGRARVLIVEDDEALARALADGLAGADFDVTVRADGVDGLAAACESAFDAIVLDLLLPRMNGFHVCGRLRELGDHTPVLVLTAKQGELDETEALETGADDYLKKPFSFAVLVARLHVLMRRRARQSPVVLQAGDLELDTATHRCTRGNVPITLTAREFALLEFLLSRRGEVVPKREILDEVWDWAIDDSSNLVEVYVGYLRRKIDAPFGRHAIETVRGVGYRVDAAGG